MSEEEATKQFYSGYGLPDIGCHVVYHTSSSGFCVGKVAGYSVSECVEKQHGSHRVFINLTNGNCRLLHDIYGINRLNEALCK